MVISITGKNSYFECLILFNRDFMFEQGIKIEKKDCSNQLQKINLVLMMEFIAYLRFYLQISNKSFVK